MLPELKNKARLTVCHRYKSHLRTNKTTQPAKAYWNHLDSGDIPPEIEALSQAEQLLLSRIHPFLKIVKFSGLYTAGKMTALLIFNLIKLFAKPTIYLYSTSLKHSISVKILIMSSNVISLPFLYHTVGNLTLNLISADSSYFFQALQVSLNSDFLLVNPLARPPFSWIC